MRHRPFVLLTALVFAMVACGGSDDSATTADTQTSEEQQAMEQWLRRIPDDPGGLLRRKFLYQYRQRAAATGPSDSQSW